MIVTGEAKEYAPFGRQYSMHHPGVSITRNQNIQPDFIDLHEFTKISLSPQVTQDNELWFVRESRTCTDFSCDEELYVSGNTVIWSRNSTDGINTVVKTCTMDTPVLQALWCKFLHPASGDVPSFGSESIEKDEIGGLCIIESSTVSIFTDAGHYYYTTPPFQISKVWNIKVGVLFERLVRENVVSAGKRNLPTQTVVFSMLHPIDEVVPVICKTTGSLGQSKVNYMTDPSQVVVFTCSDPDVALIYDTVMGIHSLWLIRVPTSEEINNVMGMSEESCFPCISTDTVTSFQLLSQSSSNQSKFTNTLSSQSTSLSPLRKVLSPSHLSHSSPSRSVHTQSSFPQSPFSRLHTPTRPGDSPGNFYRTPASSQQVSLIGCDSMMEYVKPLCPEICLQHVWTETVPAIRDGALGKASKAFIMKDLIGQQFLCYLVSYRNQLRCVKFLEGNAKTGFLFGNSNVIPAKDAQPIPGIGLLLVIDLNGNVVLYSGTTKINRVHIPGLAISSKSGLCPTTVRPVTPANLSPGGIVTSSRPTSAIGARFDEEVHLISPVPSEVDDSQLSGSAMDEFSLSHCGFVAAIRNSVNNRITLELTNGTLCRTVFPPLYSSSGISRCLNAVKYVLPREVAQLTISRWYQDRNSPCGTSSSCEWSQFYESFLTIMGYNTKRLHLTMTAKSDVDVSMSPVTSKRPRHTQHGTDEDWEYLLESKHHSYTTTLLRCMGLPCDNHVLETTTCIKSCNIDTSAPLFTYIPAIFYALHLVYEDMKLSNFAEDDSQKLCRLLLHLACDLHLSDYVDIYIRDFPLITPQVNELTQMSKDALQLLQHSPFMVMPAPNIHRWLYRHWAGLPCPAVPYIPDVTISTRNVVLLYASLLHENLIMGDAVTKCPTCDTNTGAHVSQISLSQLIPFTYKHDISVCERIVLLMTHLGLSLDDLDSIPVGIALPLREVIFHCRQNPPSDWPKAAYFLIGRQDLSQLMSGVAEKGLNISNKFPEMQKVVNEKEEDDGMSEVIENKFLRMRFAEDLRIQDVRRFLQSSRPTKIALTQRPEVNDRDFVEEQEHYLLALSVRTMAIPIGRGMFTLRTHLPLLTEMLPIPKLCLTGRTGPRNTTVEMTHIDVPTNMTVWPAFHNGVAAGLRICSSSKVDSGWILYNKPKSELTNEYGGFLMALGLNSHILNLETLNIHDYLARSHEMTSIGLMLGLAAAKRGTMDMSMTRVLSIHLPALLPPTTTELNVGHNLQVASILALGLVYHGTAHNHISEVLLSEIGRGPGPELDNCTDRESYSLAAGLAFGLVMFGKGCKSTGIRQLEMADQLCQFMIGGRRSEYGRDSFKSPSYQIKEGQNVNIDVTSPGATLALGMLFFNTNSRDVAKWLAYPDTQYMLNNIRPDFLLLRTLSRCFVMWESVEPSLDWIESLIPPVIEKYAFGSSDQDEFDDLTDIDYETMSQGYCNIMAGACLGLGLKFAGSCNDRAFTALRESMRQILLISSQANLYEKAGKNTVENSTCVILLSLAMVMAGSGNLVVLRLCRLLRSRVGPQYSHVTYGSHMAIGMSIGLLFLGGGRYTLSSRPEMIGPLICAFFPKFPKNSQDNRYHLQAFRHLYILAAEPRAVLPIDVDSGFPSYVPIQIELKEQGPCDRDSINVMAPCILPELHLIKQISILGPRYWSVVFEFSKNWNIFIEHLQGSGCIPVKLRAGNLSYSEDPKGYRGTLTKSLTVDQSSHNIVTPEQVRSFTSDAKLLLLSEGFTSDEDPADTDLSRKLSNIVYECVTQEKPDVIPTLMYLSKILYSTNDVSSKSLWQMKLILAYYGSSLHSNSMEDVKPLINNDFLLSMKSRIDSHFDKWEKDHLVAVQNYMQGGHSAVATSELYHYIEWYDVPAARCFRDLDITANSLPSLFKLMPDLKISTVVKIQSALLALDT